MAQEYEPVIGLEIHVELKTKTKMFCSCLNDAEEKIPNKNICPICLGHPGTLPTINKKAVEFVLKVGLALNSTIPSVSKFDRKNYFYPDLPKGYQISQFDQPLCKGGKLPLFLDSENRKEIPITRIHLEEDTGRLIHSHGITLVDFNRASRPLMELVTEPAIHSAKEARLFAESLQILLKNLEVSEADMEKGQMRCEVNISLRKKGEEKLGTKVEVKNLNSFKAIEKAIEFETERQAKLLENSETIIQETRGWDPLKEITYSQREKEEAYDYRYFPEPDLPPINVFESFDIESLKENIILPWQEKERIMKDYGLNSLEANLLIKNNWLKSFYEKTISCLKEQVRQNITETNYHLVYNYLSTDLVGVKESANLKEEEIKITPEAFSQIIFSLLENKISSRVAKDLIIDLAKNGGEPEKIIKERKLENIQDLSLFNKVIDKVLLANPKAVEDFKNGKTTVLQFLIGQAMKELKGAANPQELSELIKKKIESQ